MDADANRTDAFACLGYVERDGSINRLEAQVRQLQQQVEASSRSGKRQAAPFSRGLPKSDPKRPGRRGGDDYGTQAFRAVPPVIDEIHDTPLPERCPDCGGRQFIDQTPVDRTPKTDETLPRLALRTALAG